MTEDNTGQEDSTRQTATDGGESLGENGRQALQDERDARKQAEASLREARKQLRDKDTEHSRALDEAVTDARREVTADYGKRLANAEFKYRAHQRNSGFDTNSVAKYVPLESFLNDKGEFNDEVIDEAVNSLVPEGKSDQSQDINLDLGVRANSTTAHKRSNEDLFAEVIGKQLNQ